MYIFSPICHADIQIAEYDVDDILSRAGKGLHTFTANGIDYEVSLASNRYAVFKESRSCACCGIIGNRMFLCPNLETKEREPIFNLYAETYDKISGKRHLTLMTRDHIVPLSGGGSEDISNSQTMCYNCNVLKGTMVIGNKELRAMLFPAYRAYRSSIAVRKAKEEVTDKFRRMMEYALNTVRAIHENLMKAGEETRNKMLEKSRENSVAAEELRKKIIAIELEAQTTGIIPNVQEEEDNLVSYHRRLSRPLR